MNCDEYRRWFEVALKGELPSECPLEDYRRHLVSCLQCQLLLSLDEVAETIAEVARRSSASRDEAEAKRVVRLVRRRARRKLILTSSTIAMVVAALLAAGFGALHLLGGHPDTPVASPEPPAVAASPPPAPPGSVSPKEFARSLLTEDFSLSKARIQEQEKEFTLSFERKNPEADQYEWAKRVLLTDLAGSFPSVLLFTVSINEGGENVLKVQARRGQLGELTDRHRGLPGPEFCRRLKVRYDRDGLAKKPEGKE